MAGIHVSTTNAVDSVVTVRGITSRVLVLLNNVPVAQGLFVNAFAQLDNIQINDIERVEVIRGPGSAVYGADAFAGVINIVMKTSKDINGTEVGGDTYDGWFLNGGEYGGFDVALSVSGRTTDGFDATVEADAQRAFDALFGTGASHAPGSLNVDKDLIDARAEVSRGPWTLRAWYFGQLNLGAGVGVSRALDPEGTADFELTNTDLTYHDRFSDSLDLTAEVSYVNVRSDFEVTGFPPGAFGGAFPDGAHQDLGLNEDRARVEVTGLWTGIEQHWLRAGLRGVFESSDTTEDIRNYTVRQGFPVPTGTFAEGGGINDVPIFPDEDRTTFFTYLLKHPKPCPVTRVPTVDPLTDTAALPDGPCFARIYSAERPFILPIRACLPQCFTEPMQVWKVVLFAKEAPVAVVAGLHDVQGKLIQVNTRA